MAIIPDEEVKKIKEIKGEAIGASLKEDLQFILKKEGPEGLKKVEEEMKKLGYSLKLAEIKNFQWYPFFYNFLILVAAKYIFNWNDGDFRENGRFSAKISVILRIMLKYFISPKRSFDNIGAYWRKYYTVGEVKTEEFDEEGRTAVIVFSDFVGHPVFCRILEGYVTQIFSYILPTESLNIEETECPFKGGKVHKIKLKW